MADDEPTALDPAQTLGPDDPLRAWADQNIDWRTGRLLTQDPQKAIESMISRGIPPPDVHAAPPDALPFADPYGNNINPETGMPISPNVAKLSPDPIRTNPDGSLARNLTGDQSPVVPKPKPTAPENPLDPEEATATPPSVPLPKPRPDEAGPGASDVSAAKKKPSVGDALSDFSKSLTGVKPVPPPPLNPVGTPSVRSPGAVSPPNIANLIALMQGGTPPSVAATLGKLLVAGKA